MLRRRIQRQESAVKSDVPMIGGYKIAIVATADGHSDGRTQVV